MRFDPQELADRERAPLDEPGLGAPAGVFLLDGALHVAPFATRAAAHLRERGGLLIAALYFEQPVAERAVSGGGRGADSAALRPLRAPRDLPSLGGPSGPN
jgi:hypothetical protein